ncbi:MAG TPA: AAA family ATPase [Trebonia sp.]
MTQPSTGETTPLLIGRDTDAARLRSLSGPVGDQGRALVVLGAPGIGKSALLADATRQASLAGTRILTATGTKTKADVPFAGLRELIGPVLDSAARLPAEQANSLGAISGTGLAPSHWLPTGIGLLALLTELSRSSPLLVAVDDAHQFDRDSLAALAFAAHRLGSEPVAVVLAARGDVPPPGLGPVFAGLLLPPLTVAAAAQLLDRQPEPPRGRARHRVLAQAGGNPAALTELSRAVAAARGDALVGGSEPLPLSARLTGDIDVQVAALPESTRHALLLAAVASGDEADFRAAAAYAARMGPELFAPAEWLGLVKVGAGRVHLAHPFIRAAVYYSASPGDRRLAHREVADLLRARPARRAWHLAAAAARPDERVAALLEREAARLPRGRDAAPAAVFLARAAELSPDPRARARRLADASASAIPTGEADWIGELSARVRAVTDDQDLRVTADQAAGWAGLWAGQPGLAAAALAAVSARTASRRPDLAWTALADAASAGYLCGAPDVLAAIRTARGHLDGLDRPPQAGCRADRARPQDADLLRLWIRLAAGERRPGGEAERLLRQAADPSVLRTAGLTAWLLDRTELALALFRRTVEAAQATGPHDPLCAPGWAYLDAGRWDEAELFAARARDFQAEAVSTAADLITATIGAARGDTARPRSRLAGIPGADPARNRAVAARAWHARGLAALAAGDAGLAYRQLRPLFGADGSPFHPHVSFLGTADLALASARTGRHAAGLELLDRAEAGLGADRSARLDQLLGHARALLTQSGPQPHFEAALAVPEGGSWPFERARLRLDYGEWLRRQRRISAARPLLTSALEAFRALRAAPWAQRAEAELRACGVAAAAAPAAAALLELPPAQRQVVVMAAGGMTNREIARELFLSPRTVSTYLYLAYPKLGVARRHQLRDVVGEAAR